MKKRKPKPAKLFVPCLPEYEADQSEILAKSKRTTMEAILAKARRKGQ